ncbi:MAG: methyl-accepting chemotaxis protein [Pseudomonadota bacterium]
MSEQQSNSAITRLLVVLLPLALIGAGVWIYLQAGNKSEGSGNAAEVAALSQSLPRLAEQFASGESDDGASLEQALRRLTALRSDYALPGNAALWNQLLEEGSNALSAGRNLSNLKPATQSVAERLPEFVAGGAELLANNGGVAVLDEFNAAATDLGVALDEFANRQGNMQANEDQASGALAYMGQVLGALSGETAVELDIKALEESSDLAQLSALRTAFGVISRDSAAALDMAEDIRSIDGAILKLNRTSAQLLDPVSSQGSEPSASGPDWILLGLLGLAALLSIWVAIQYLRTARIAGVAAHQADQNERNQQAILRLLDELGSLADGDLTVEATVTEDITGAIADSINYAIEALRDLVATINDTAIMVDSAAKQTEAAAQNMSSSARQQAVEVTATTDALGSIVASIEEVSGNAERSSDVARHSVDVAHKGGEAVRRTIDGMNAIRETIQETSKRIKRLGESSQEIGNIVELINDIAEQTNILALNASIQASMAGEAGRGFAVVADEVQRLAERCTNATKQIEVLVRTIQTDTNEAVVSMERSTTDVFGGALLAENAGAALDEIEQVSNQIASLVQNISGSAREQSSVAADIDQRTSNLQKISDKTGRETQATAAAIHKLSELASQLRDTVAGFQLPDVGAASGVYATEAERRAVMSEPEMSANDSEVVQA